MPLAPLVPYLVWWLLEEPHDCLRDDGAGCSARVSLSFRGNRKLHAPRATGSEEITGRSRIRATSSKRASTRSALHSQHYSTTSIPYRSAQQGCKLPGDTASLLFFNRITSSTNYGGF